VWVAFLWPAEPKYQGRYLSDWFTEYLTFRDNSHKGLEAESALRAIGTNGLPFYLKWMRYEPAQWQSTLFRKLPSWITKSKVVRDWRDETAARLVSYSHSRVGIQLLGTNAVSAIPELVTIMKDRSKLYNSMQACYALATIGEPALPALQDAFADTNASYRHTVVMCVSLMTSDLGHTNTTGPLLTAALHDPDETLREAAKICLRQIHWRSHNKAPGK
jgi:hypothetical protein